MVRARLGTQTDVAPLLGMTQPMISRIERGERQPTNQQAAALRLLADLVDCRRLLAQRARFDTDIKTGRGAT